jgi:hypothetical protein
MNAETRDAISAARIVTRGAIKTLRTELQVLANLLERLDTLDAQPLEAQRNGYDRNRNTVRH